MLDYSSVTAESLRSDTNAALATCDAIIADIVGIDGDRTWENTGEPFLEVDRILSRLYGGAPFLYQAHGDAEVRKAARELQEQISQWGVKTAYRRDLYEAVAAYAEHADLDGELARWLEHEMRDYRMTGHDLDEAARAELERLNGRLAELSVAFSSNLADNDDVVIVATEDLTGLPDVFVEGLADGDEPGTKRVTMAYPDVIPILQSCETRAVREAVSFAFNNRCVDENRPILEETIAKRIEVAELFGVPSWAHHTMQRKMAQTPEAVSEFYDDLVPPLTEKGREELATLENLLVGDGGSLPFLRSDYSYYEEVLRRTEYGVDQHEVSHYFELEATIDALFDITGRVFGLTYERVPDAPTWHPDAVLYAVSDAESGEVIGHFFADLFPREGKFGHAAAFPLLKAHESRDGWVTPVTAFLCNFPRPTERTPSLLRHDDVVTLFHEFGHVLHMTLSRATTPRFSGASTEWDFVEAPSQIMENWCWTPEVLTSFARHHETGEPIPAELVDQLVAARYLNVALFSLRQISLGMIDMGLHAVSEVPDIDEVLAEADAVSLVRSVPGTFMAASFGHLFGYDAGYYGYLWAKVFGDDMFSVFAEAGATDPEVGMRYRRTILEPNGTKDAIDLLHDFLGREPSNEAFLAGLGI
jgi:Zn-dependent oligopeptidase